jgi:hypothetical protein
MRGHGISERIGVDLSRGQRGMDVAPPTTMEWGEAQTGSRGKRDARHQRVRHLEQGIGTMVQAG